MFCTICSYGNYIYHYSDRAATLSDLCHTNVLGNVVHTKVIKATVEFHKARKIFALVVLFPKSNYKAECVVAIDAN